MEGGLRSHRTEFVRESTTGTTPSDPGWNAYSDTVRSIEWAADAQIEGRRGLGDAAPANFYNSLESHEVTITYDLQQWFTSGGSAQDAAYDGLTRDSDNQIPNTHSFVDREDKSSISAGQTVNGSTSYATRIYTVGKGGYLDEVTIGGDPGSDQPVTVELSYQFEKVRSYQVDQPSSSTELVAKSTDSNDTTQTLTVEDEGAATSATFTLNGTSIVASDTSVSFDNIDAVELDAETDGDVELYINDGTNSSPTQGDQLTTLRGKNSYSGEGDLGVPALGAGSHAGSIGSSYEQIIGDTVERPAGTSLAFSINSVEFAVSNNVETNTRLGGTRLRIHDGPQDVEVSATVLGESESHQQIIDHLQAKENTVRWTMDGGNIEADNAAITDVGDRSIESGQAMMTLDNTFTGQGVTIN